MRLDRTKLLMSIMTIALASGMVLTVLAKAPETGKSVEAAQAETKSAEVKVLKSSGSCLVDETALEDLRKKREELDAKAKQLSDLEAELKSRATAIEEQLKTLQAVRDDIARLNQVSDKANAEKVSKLVETIETMSPKSAAAMLAGMDEALTVSAMSRMDTQRLAKVLGQMEPARSSRLAEILAGVTRARTLPPSNDGAVVANDSAKGGEKKNGNIDKYADGDSNGAPGRELGSQKQPVIR